MFGKPLNRRVASHWRARVRLKRILFLGFVKHQIVVFDNVGCTDLQVQGAA